MTIEIEYIKYDNLVYEMNFKEEINMIHVITGDTGEGKTLKLIQAANETLEASNGNIVYIDGDNSHMYDLRHEIRYINISEFPIDDYHEFFGFMCGILSEDHDISFIYVDGLLKMAHLCEISNSDELINKLKALTDKFGVRLVASINCDESALPDFLKEFAKN